MHFSASEIARLAQCLADPWAGYVRSLGTVVTGDFPPTVQATGNRALMRLRMALLDLHCAVADWEDDDS